MIITFIVIGVDKIKSNILLIGLNTTYIIHNNYMGGQIC